MIVISVKIRRIAWIEHNFVVCDGEQCCRKLSLKHSTSGLVAWMEIALNILYIWQHSANIEEEHGLNMYSMTGIKGLTLFSRLSQ